ncbi:hypothetical protein BDV36DRAFT_250355 [Aspergillus pseudocaelatus]|uniref:Secreted protein n=1 Tax=Aspergillus pseudocaelatus TaxID=1825620 RepID=A0ABQ6WSC3_9EURO|nr:hypothetical protein BDV36DRAFT_250355 [Aspergillus pseudocaelatus]
MVVLRTATNIRGMLPAPVSFSSPRACNALSAVVVLLPHTILVRWRSGSVTSCKIQTRLNHLREQYSSANLVSSASSMFIFSLAVPDRCSELEKQRFPYMPAMMILSFTPTRIRAITLRRSAGSLIVATG